jgi:hypothetical protein
MKNKTLVTLGIVGGLVALGGLAYTYLRKPKLNSDGFYNASGTGKAAPTRCTRCRTVDGDTYVPARDSYPQCDFKGGERCLTNAV